MKSITESGLVKICDATPTAVTSASLLLGKTFSEDVAWLKIGVEQGHYRAATLKIKEVDCYLIVYHVNPQKVLFVNAAAQLTQTVSDFNALLEGIFALAKALQCQAVETMTLRAGLLKKLLADGFEPIGVSVMKPV